MIREMPPYPHDGSWHVYKMAGLLTSQCSSNAHSAFGKFETWTQILMHTRHLETGNRLGCIEVLICDHTSSEVHVFISNGLLHFPCH